LPRYGCFHFQYQNMQWLKAQGRNSTHITEWKFNSAIKERLRIMIQITSKSSGSILAQHLNSHGHHLFWKEYRVQWEAQT
jgi:hypothetical protein